MYIECTYREIGGVLQLDGWNIPGLIVVGRRGRDRAPPPLPLPSP